MDDSRIMKELNMMKEEVKNGNSEVIDQILVVGDEHLNWKVKIFGPKDTYYEGEIYEVDITIPNEYPFKPPIMIFETGIYHPNICF
jgi:ubiquitin-protein ligase